MTRHPNLGAVERRKALSANVFAPRKLQNLRRSGALQGALRAIALGPVTVDIGFGNNGVIVGSVSFGFGFGLGSANFTSNTYDSFGNIIATTGSRTNSFRYATRGANSMRKPACITELFQFGKDAPLASLTVIEIIQLQDIRPQ